MATRSVGESVVFERHIGRQIPLPQDKNFVGTKLTSRIARYFFIALFITFILIFFRLFYLQVIRGGEYREAAEGNRQKIIPIFAERGLIFDANGAQLTKNIPNFYLALVPQELPRNLQERELVIEKL